MGSESDPEDGEAANDLPAMESAAAFGLALAVASRDKADAFLDAQTAIAWLQKEHLHEQRHLQISHLKWRRFNDWMRSGWQAMLIVFGALAVVAIGTALWQASRANGLVVDAFTVPPDFEQRGVGGDVIAGDMTDRLVAIRAIAVSHSYSNTNDVSQNRANEIKVEIPDTGISLGEAWRYLRRWLGHERHVTGSLREAGDGNVVLAASVEGCNGFSVSGKPAQLPALEMRLAEDVFGGFDPVNHINYLSATGRQRAAYEAATRYVQTAYGVLQRADSYGLWSYTTAQATGNIALGLARARIGIAIDPDLAVLHVQAFKFYGYLGRDEGALSEARAVLPLRNEDQIPAHQGGGFAEMQGEARTTIAELTGDFRGGANWACDRRCTISRPARAIFAARAHDMSQALSLASEAFAAGEANPGGLAPFYIDAEMGHWQAALADAKAASAVLLASDGEMSRHFLETIAATNIGPLLAEAEARTGNFAAAHEQIDNTPGDCAACLTERGMIDALQKHWDRAGYWFARAVAEAPSMPFACTDWGEMLLRKGDYAGAIAKFALAHEKGPHFADPVEMWGEALMQENRSDLALAKFEEANRYAPNWGRLHFEWGKALFYAGHKDDARKQFALAANLDLAQSDKAALNRWHPG